MVGIVVLSHGSLAEGLCSAAELIFGGREQCDSLGLFEGEDFALFTERVRGEIERLDRGDGVLVLVDLYGASPYNAVAKLLPQLEEKGHSVQMLTGANLPMLLEAQTLRESRTLPQLTQALLSTAREAIQAPIQNGRIV
ncbi:MAG: PTS sugar transporter subunit IIA [Ndongobacter sp.]|nr:PTS sugar transporter subunit IIA [Ndongobacter sp.]